MKIALIADVHIGPSAYHKGVRRKLTEFSEQFICGFVDHVSSSEEYTFAIHLGDLIQDSDRDSDMEGFQRGVQLFSRSLVPVHHVVGNHDTVHLHPDEIRPILGYDSLYYSFDLEGFHFVVLHSHVPIPKQPRIIIPKEEMEWLAADLSNTNKPSIVFMHHSCADQDLTGNPWFEGNPQDCLVENRVEVRKILSQSHKVVAVVNGHLHWNNVILHDGIPYITVQSATENFRSDGVPANAWGIMEVTGKRFSLLVQGKDPASYEYDFCERITCTLKHRS